MMLDAQRLVAAGGKEWKRDSRHRVYFENVSQLYGLRYEVDPRSGDITTATLDGVVIGVEEARDLLSRLKDVKIWYDLGRHRFQWRDSPEIKRIAEKVVQAIQLALPPDEAPDPTRIHEYGSAFHVQASQELDAAFKRGDTAAKAQAQAKLTLVKPRPSALTIRKKVRRW